MEVFSSTRVSDSLTDNRQSKSGSADQKRSRGPKWLGLVALGVALALYRAVAEAQQPAKIPKIGWLHAGTAASDLLLPGLLREFRALGSVDGKNITFEFRYAEQEVDRLPALVDELVRFKVDVLLARRATCGASCEECYQNDPHRIV